MIGNLITMMPLPSNPTKVLSPDSPVLSALPIPRTVRTPSSNHNSAKTQNLTVAVSFGAERQAAFEHAKTKTTISMWQPNGTIYTFGRDVNVMWRHGIPGNGFRSLLSGYSL